MTKDEMIVAAKRIKELREGTKKEGTDKHLSHARLREELLKEENLSISVDSLMMYEVTDEYHTKFGAIEGMSVKTLCALADYYGTSTDYVLGRTNLRTADTNLRAICEYTGLSEGALGQIMFMKEKLIRIGNRPLIDTFNALLDCPTKGPGLVWAVMNVAGALDGMQKKIEQISNTKLDSFDERGKEIIRIVEEASKYGYTLLGYDEYIEKKLQDAMNSFSELINGLVDNKYEEIALTEISRYEEFVLMAIREDGDLNAKT